MHLPVAALPVVAVVDPLGLEDDDAGRIRRDRRRRLPGDDGPDDATGHAGQKGQGEGGGGESRPQKGGEGGTTRFGMEDGDNTDVPATGAPEEGEEAAERAS